MDDQDNINLEEQKELIYTQNVRRKIVEELFKNSKLPDDPKDKTVLLQALDGMDRQVISKAKIRAEDKSNKTGQGIADMVANLLIQVQNNSIADHPNSQLPKQLDDSIKPTKLVPGMLETGMVNIEVGDVIRGEE